MRLHGLLVLCAILILGLAVGAAASTPHAMGGLPGAGGAMVDPSGPPAVAKATFPGLPLGFQKVRKVDTNENCDLCLYGNIGFQINGDKVQLLAETIANERSGGRSGTMRLALWAHTNEFDGNGGLVYHYQLGVYQFSSQLAGGQFFSNVNRTVDYQGDPPDGCYYLSIVLQEFSDGAYYYVDWLTFDDCLSMDDSDSGACCAGASTPTPTPRPSSTPTVSPSPSPIPSVSGQTAVANLTSTYWAGRAIAGFDAPSGAIDNGLVLTVVGNPAFSFGYWETAQPLQPLSSGVYRLTATLVPIGSGGDRPDVRLRVFDSTGLTQYFGTVADSGPNDLPTTITTYFPALPGQWGVAVDLLSFNPNKSGGFRVSSMALARVD